MLPHPGSSKKTEVPLGRYPWTPWLAFGGPFALVPDLAMAIDGHWAAPPASPAWVSLTAAAGLAIVFIGLWWIGDRAGVWRDRRPGTAEWGVIPLTFGTALALWGHFVASYDYVPSLDYLFVETAGLLLVAGLVVLHDVRLVRQLPPGRWDLAFGLALMAASLASLGVLHGGLWVLEKFPSASASGIESIMLSWLGLMVALGWFVAILITVDLTLAIRRNQAVPESGGAPTPPRP